MNRRKGLPLEMEGEVLVNSMQDMIREMLLQIGEDPDREGLEKTPERVEKSLLFLTNGYRKDVSKVVNGAIYSTDFNDLVTLKDISFFSLCEHHLLPFFGKCHVAYIPDGRIIGLSKIPRIIEVFSRRLQVQERMTNQIFQCLKDMLNPSGIAVVVEALHLCMTMRGVKKSEAYTVTRAMAGDFKHNSNLRKEFLSLIGKSNEIE